MAKQSRGDTGGRGQSNQNGSGFRERKRDFSGALKVNGPFEESWMGRWNAEAWPDRNASRNDATGYSYDE